MLGMPLLHVTQGIDPATGEKRVARGFFAFGEIAHGVFAFGGYARGWFACGGLAVGGVAIGGLSIGLLSWGGFACLKMGARKDMLERVDRERNERFIVKLMERIDWFWRKHVLPRIPPKADDSEASRKALLQMHPTDNGRVYVLPSTTVQLLADYREAKADEAGRTIASRTEALADAAGAQHRHDAGGGGVGAAARVHARPVGGRRCGARCRRWKRRWHSRRCRC